MIFNDRQHHVGANEINGSETDGSKWQIITECWIEPQNGIAVNCDDRWGWMGGLDYKNIASKVRIF